MSDARDVNPPSVRLKERAYLSAVEAMPCVHTVFKDDLGIWVYLCDGWHWGQTGVGAVYAETLPKLKAAMHLVAADRETK